MWCFSLWVFLSSRQELRLVTTKSEPGGGHKRIAGGIAPVMNARYLAADAFIDVVNTRSRLEGDE